jgi:sugar-phosphatase
MDGTLVDSSVVCERAWREWATMVGVDPVPILAIHHGRRPEETLRLTYPKFSTPEAAAWMQDRQVGSSDGLSQIPGAAALLDALGEIPWAVVTSATRALAEDRLRAVGLWRGQFVVGADDVSEGKPSPEGYLAAARRLGVPPTDCVVFEDAPAGIEAGMRAGMPVIGVVSTHPIEALATPYLIRDLTRVSSKIGPDSRVELSLA